LTVEANGAELTLHSLAYSEMRLILALVIFNFDLQISEESNDWIQQKNFLMWQKHPLKVYLQPVV
jgi:hypothetical protein